MAGGNLEPHIGLPCFIDMNYGAGVKLTENARTLQSRYYKGISNYAGETSGVAIKIIAEVNSSQDGKVHDISGIAKCHSAGHNNSPKIAIPCDVKCININNENGKERSQQDRAYDVSGIMTALNSQLGGRHNIAIPVLTPDRAEKRQNGRRFKENGDSMFTLTAQDRHGVAIEPIVMSGNVVSESENICKCLNANDQRKVFGAKQERTMVSVRMNKPIGIVGGLQEHQTIREDGISPSLTSAMGMGGGQTPCVFLEQSVKPKQGDGIYVEMPGGFLAYCVWYEKEQCYITIRKLTPKECFRLQGWTDDYFERAALVNSDSQLYKQAGNGVTVDVVYAIGKKIEECVEESLERFSKYMNKPKKGEE